MTSAWFREEMMNVSLCLLPFAAALLALFGRPAAADAEFAFKETTPTAIELTDNGKPVYVYNFGMTLAKGFPESMRRAAHVPPRSTPARTMTTAHFHPNHPPPPR